MYGTIVVIIVWCIFRRFPFYFSWCVGASEEGESFSLRQTERITERSAANVTTTHIQCPNTKLCHKTGNQQLIKSHWSRENSDLQYVHDFGNCSCTTYYYIGITRDHSVVCVFVWLWISPKPNSDFRFGRLKVARMNQQSVRLGGNMYMYLLNTYSILYNIHTTGMRCFYCDKIKYMQRKYFQRCNSDLLLFSLENAPLSVDMLYVCVCVYG